jgi:hypothetical protein
MYASFDQADRSLLCTAQNQSISHDLKQNYIKHFFLTQLLLTARIEQNVFRLKIEIDDIDYFVALYTFLTHFQIAVNNALTM